MISLPNKDPYRVFPPATEMERRNLKESLNTFGLKNPLVIDEHGKIIDGHLRRDICEEIGIDWYIGADMRIGLTREDKMALAIELNLWRKPLHLTKRQRDELIEIYLIANCRLSDGPIAELFGVSQPTVFRRRKRLIQLNKLQSVEATVGRDGVRRIIGNRKTSRLLVKNKTDFDKLAPDIVEVANDLSGLIRRPSIIHSKARKKREKEAAKSYDTTFEHDHIQMHCCRFQDLEQIASIKPASVNLILTDIPYGKEFLSQIEELGQFAERILVPGGVFATYCGHYWFPHVVQALGRSLQYRWTNASVWDGDASRVHFPDGRTVLSKWKPILIYSKGEFATKGLWYDVSKVNRKEKEWHPWQQPLEEVKTLIGYFSKQTDLIVEPCGGSFTTALSCLELNRRCIACDCDHDAVARGRERLARASVVA